MKSQCDEHGCSELLCGCHVSELEGKGFMQIYQIILDQAVEIAALKGKIERLEGENERFRNTDR